MNDLALNNKTFGQFSTLNVEENSDFQIFLSKSSLTFFSNIFGGQVSKLVLASLDCSVLEVDDVNHLGRAIHGVVRFRIAHEVSGFMCSLMG